MNNMIKYKDKKKTLLILTFILLLSTIIVQYSLFTPHASNDEDLANRVLCRFEDGKELANLRSTDYFYYKFRSKSAVTSTDGVNSNWLNKLLSVADYDFNEVNEAVLGRELNPASIPESGSVNGGPKVSAFDRFGMAGMKWSSYQGEWKYYYVNACQSGQVSPTTYGTYYETRHEPQSTYNEVNTSKDPRTIQFNKGVMSLIATGLSDIIANALFAIAKGLVTLTILFVGLAFTDITVLMGLTADGSGGISSATIFTSLYDIVFQGFILFAILFTAIYIIYNGLIKRQLRLAMNTLIKTIIIFIIATIMSINPSYWIGVPNKVATYGQAIVLSTMAGVYDGAGTPTLCSTEVGSIGDNVDIGDNFDETHLMTQFEKTNENMRSLIGCQMWEVLLFRPWVRGQFGAEYEDLHDANLGNVNSEWVGNGTVLMGGGETINNWALFQLSAQTDAHAEIGDNSFRTIVTGVNADWWRIVDALSNYDEDEVSENINGAFTGTYVDQTSFNTTEYWQTWVGNNAIHRIGTAIMTIAFAIAGSLPPLVFAFSSAMYGLGITLLMMMSPLFFLLGTWGGKGDHIFLGWVSSLGNTILKRIGVSVLLILSIAFTINIMNLVYTVGFVQSFVLMIVVTVVLIKNKNKMLSMLASINLGGSFDPTNKASQILDKSKRTVGSIGKIGVATGAGAITGHRTGQGLREGATSGAIHQIRNTLYQSMLGTTIVREMDIMTESKENMLHNCIQCFAILGQGGKDIAFRDDEGNYYCIHCAEDMGIENLNEVEVGSNEEIKYEDTSYTRTIKSTMNRSYVSHGELRKSMKSEYKDGEYNWDTKNVQDMVKGNLRNLGIDTMVFKNLQEQMGKKRRPPSAPEPLHQYIDVALLNLAWTSGNHEAVENTYKEAWKSWYEDNAKYVEGMEKENIDEFLKEIDDLVVEINEEEAREMFIEDTQELIKNKIIEDQSDKDMYIYKNGKLTLNTYE